MGFLMDYERLEFPEAVESLAQTVGLQVPKEELRPGQTPPQDTNRPILEQLEQATRFYEHSLRKHPEAKRAVAYLKGRGLSGEIARAFRVGFAPPGWDNLLQTADNDAQQIKRLTDGGMLVTNDRGRTYDRFRDRIVFPILDARGRVIAFGGRVLGDDKPKYLNSPETPVFHKSRELYGLYQARKSERSLNRIVVVEGYMDVIALAQYGIGYAVATLGTATSQTHLERVYRLCPEVVFCFDGDSAGRRAAARSLEIALPEMRDGVSAKFLFLPDGEDPDSMVRQLGTEAFLEQVEKSQPLSEFLFEQLSDGIDSSTADGKARLSKTCAPQINRIPQGVFRQLMLEELSRRTGVSADNLRDYVATHVTPQQRAAIVNEANHETGSQTQSTDRYNHAASNDYHYPEQDSSLEADYYADMRPTRASKIRLSPIKFITALLLNHPALAEAVEDIGFLKQSTDQDTQLFLRVLDVAKKNPHYKPSHIFAYWLGTHGNQAETKILQSLAASELYHPPVGTGRDDHQEFSDALAHVIQSAFDALPIQEKALHLLEQKTLSEREIKQLHRIRLQLANDQQSNDLKNKIKQRLVV